MATRMWWGDSDVEAEEEAATRKGPWTVEEDMQLIRNIRLHGEGRWSFLAKAAGLKRTGRSTRLRWVNSLRPDLKRGKITPEEERLIIELHGRWGNRWSHIARSVRGRTDNEIKNYCRTRFKGKLNLQVERASSGMDTESHVHFKRSMGSCCSPISTQRPPDIHSAEPLNSFPTQNTEISVQENPNPDLQEDIPPQVIRSREGNYESGQPGEIHGPQINDAEQPSAALQEHLEGSHKQMFENSSPYNFSVGPLATLLDSSEFCLDGATQDGTIPPLSSYMVASPKAISETVSYLNCYSNVLWNMDEEDVRISPPSFYVVDSPDAFSDSESYLNCYSDVLWNMDQEDDGFNGSKHYAPCRNER